MRTYCCFVSYFFLKKIFIILLFLMIFVFCFLSNLIYKWFESKKIMKNKNLEQNESNILKEVKITIQKSSHFKSQYKEKNIHCSFLERKRGKKKKRRKERSEKERKKNFTGGEKRKKKRERKKEIRKREEKREEEKREEKREDEKEREERNKSNSKITKMRLLTKSF